MKKQEHRRHGIIAIVLRAGAIIVLGLIFAFEAYTIVVQREGDAPLPPLFKLRGTTYIVTGGGGGHLAKKPGNQFHHALVIRVTPNSVDQRIVFVPPHNDFEDRLEKLAITEAWPWMHWHPYLAIAMNTLGFLVLIILVGWPFTSHRRKTYLS